MGFTAVQEGFNESFLGLREALSRSYQPVAPCPAAILIKKPQSKGFRYPNRLVAETADLA